MGADRPAGEVHGSGQLVRLGRGGEGGAAQHTLGVGRPMAAVHAVGAVERIDQLIREIRWSREGL